MTTRIKFKRDTAANWVSNNPILAAGETGFETDTRTIKIGDGVTTWNDLGYAVTGGLKVADGVIHSDTSVGISSGIGNRENWILLTQSNTGDIAAPTDAYSDGIAYDSEGNAISMGWYDSESYGTGCYLQKTSPSGEVLFNVYYNERMSFGFGMGVDKNNDIILLLGENMSSSDDIVLLKVSGVDGTIIWQKYINSLGDNADYASCMDIDAAGDIFITGKSYDAVGEGNDVAYVAKFSGDSGQNIWSKCYDIEYFDSEGTGLKVDKDGNLAVVGTVDWAYEFATVYKIDGANGDLLWEAAIKNIKYDNGNNPLRDGVNGGTVQGSDIASDSQGNFYVSINNWHPDYPGVVAVVAKLNGTTGKVMWSRQHSFDDYRVAAGSVACDEQDNVYVSTTLIKSNYTQDQNSNSRKTQNIAKINATGSVIWQRWLLNEQAETTDGKATFNNNNNTPGQSIAVKGKYLLVGGTYEYQYAYNGDNQGWYTQPYVAQLSTDGKEFEVNGWHFKDSSNDVANQFVTLLVDRDNWSYNPTSVSNFDITVSNGTVVDEGNSDTSALVYLNKTNVNVMTFSEKTLTLPAGGAVDISREQIGYFTSVAKQFQGTAFDGHEGWNTNGANWMNGSARDEKGNTYAAGGWYSDNNSWNNWTDYVDVPLVSKLDSTGKLVWSAGTAVDQGGADLVDVVYHQNTNTVVVLGNDGELDGNEGFNISYLDADTGSMKQDITHIRPAQGTNDIWPLSLTIMSDGSPVVAGYLTSAQATYANVTTDGAGLTGSTNSGTLVIPKSVFELETTSYPKEDSTWYVYPGGYTIQSVNRFGHDDSEGYPATTYTGTLGSGAVVDVQVFSGEASITIQNGGSGYKAGHQIKILGSDMGGTSPANDLYLYIDTITGEGTIASFTGNSWDSSAAPDATYTTLATVALAPSGVLGWVRYAPEGTEYTTFNIDNGGTYYGEGDTFKILGNVLGGVTPDNDLTVTVTGINNRGQNNGQVNGVTLSGTPQSANVKIYTGSVDFTQAGVFNITHEIGSDAFIWTPNWTKVFGANAAGYVYDDAHGITVDSSDNVIVGGYSDNTGLTNTWYGSGQQTGIVSKFSSEGELLWTKSIDASEGYSTVWGVATDADDNIYSVMTSSNANDDPYITKMSSDGDYIWQQSIQVNNSTSWSIATADDGSVMIAGRTSGNWTSNNYHRYNQNILVVKFDKDGNKLFSRLIWSQNGIRQNYNTNYSNQLTIKGDRFSYVAHSDDPGNWDYSGLVVDLPIDGTGTGAYADFFYEEVETQYGFRFEDNFAGSNQIVTDITANVSINPYEFVDAPYIDSDDWRNVTIYAQREDRINKVYKPEGGEVKGVAKITFEDGSVQTSSMQGLPQVARPQSSIGRSNYYLRPEDNGKHILQDYSNTVYIPDPSRVELPAGYAITIINRSNNSGVASENNSEDIYLSGDNGNNSNSYEIPYWTMATLVKLKSGQWMIAGAGLTSGW